MSKTTRLLHLSKTSTQCSAPPIGSKTATERIRAWTSYKDLRQAAAIILLFALAALPAFCQVAPPVTLGLKLWLRSDAGVTLDGSGHVTRWADQSGAGHDYARQASYIDPFGQYHAFTPPSLAAGGPNAAPVVSFDGAANALRNGDQIVAGNNVTIFTVMSVKTPSYPWALGESYQPNPGASGYRMTYEGLPQYPDGFDLAHEWSNDARATLTGIGDPRFKVISITGSGVMSNMTVFADGVPAVMSLDPGAQIDAAIQFSPGNTLGFTWGSPVLFSQVEFAEYLIYDRALSATERAVVENYLMHRYFIADTPMPASIRR